MWLGWMVKHALSMQCDEVVHCVCRLERVEQVGPWEDANLSRLPQSPELHCPIGARWTNIVSKKQERFWG